jgi:hypothetical protein
MNRIISIPNPTQRHNTDSNKGTTRTAQLTVSPAM